MDFMKSYIRLKTLMVELDFTELNLNSPDFSMAGVAE